MNWPQTIAAPLRRWLDAFTAQPGRIRIPVAVVAAILAHGVVICVVLLFAFLGQFLPASCTARTSVALPIPKPKPLEVTLETRPSPAPAEPLTAAEEEKLQELFQELPLDMQREVIDVEGLAKQKNLSKRALLESWQDSVAGTGKRGKGHEPLPSQEGRDDLPFTDFKNQQSRLGSGKDEPGERKPSVPIPYTEPTPPLYKPEPVPKPEMAQSKPENIPTTAQPAPAPPPPSSEISHAKPPEELKRVTEASKDEIPLYVFAPSLPGVPEVEPPKPVEKPEPPTETPKPTPDPTPTPTPTPTPVTKAPTPKPAVKLPRLELKPQKDEIRAPQLASLRRPTPVPDPGYAPHMEKRKIEGGDLPEGQAGLDAVATERGRYMKGLKQAVGSRWTYYVRDVRQASLITVGSVTLKVSINAKGKITRVQVTDNTANSAYASLCERALLESQGDITPPPRELLRNGTFEDTFTFTLY